MASSKEYLNFILEQLSDLDGVRHRAMMGEYLLYYRDRLFGGLYDNRLLVKPVEAAKALLPNAPLESPYDGAKAMLLVEDVENRALLSELIPAMYDQIPPPKPKKSKAK